MKGDVNADVKAEDNDEMVDIWYRVNSDLISGISGYHVGQEPTVP